MTWNAFRHRGEALRAVVTLADERLDGLLPLDAPGVAEHFHDEVDLVSALLLKWHTRLSGNIERALMREPLDLSLAVATAWRETAEQMPGVRAILDRHTHAGDAELEQVCTRARELEWGRLALAAGIASAGGPVAVAAGRDLEQAARAGLPPQSRRSARHTPPRHRAERPQEPTDTTGAAGTVAPATSETAAADGEQVREHEPETTAAGAPAPHDASSLVARIKEIIAA